jgi:hypothetical protein
MMRLLLQYHYMLVDRFIFTVAAEPNSSGDLLIRGWGSMKPGKTFPLG